MRSEEIAWAAGLFEGEGCFSYDKTYGSCRMIVGSTDLDVLDKFKNIMGIGSITKDKEKPNRKPAWRWQTTNREEFDYGSDLLRPWLGVRRTARLNEIISLRQEVKRGSETVCRYGHDKALLDTGRWVCHPCRAESQKRYVNK